VGSPCRGLACLPGGDPGADGTHRQHAGRTLRSETTTAAGEPRRGRLNPAPGSCDGPWFSAPPPPWGQCRGPSGPSGPWRRPCWTLMALRGATWSWACMSLSDGEVTNVFFVSMFATYLNTQQNCLPTVLAPQTARAASTTTFKRFQRNRISWKLLRINHLVDCTMLVWCNEGGFSKWLFYAHSTTKCFDL
jgi:hypothetical protein